MEKSTKWITQKRAAEILGKSLGAVHALMTKGRWRTKIVFDKKLVNRADVVNYIPLKPGRPRKMDTQGTAHSTA